MKLGILLTNSPFTEDFYTVIQLTKHALEQKYEVSIFIMDDGAYCVPTEQFKELIKAGAKIIVCAHNAEQRAVKEVEGFVFGSQTDWAQIVTEADRILGFGWRL